MCSLECLAYKKGLGERVKYQSGEREEKPFMCPSLSLSHPCLYQTRGLGDDVLTIT